MEQDLEKARANPIKSVSTATPWVTLQESVQKDSPARVAQW